MRLNKSEATRVRSSCFRASLVLVGALLASQAMAQGVRWEDYRGDQNAASDANYNGPAGAPKFVNNPNSGAIAALRVVSANSANAVRTGTSNTIDFGSGATDALCDNRSNTTNVPCRLQAQGKVAYALVRFPQAGTYSIAAAHDDNVVIELSPEFTNINYRTASYSILAGQVSDWSNSETDFQTFGTFTAANANSCALLRMYWNNQGGLNFNHLRWTTPGGTTEIIPASALRDPAAVSSATGCNGSITGNVAGITLNKVIGSPRINAADQFTIQIGTTADGGTVATATTTGSGTGQQASTNFATTTGTTYHVREVMASGSSSALTAYTAAISCTRNGTAFTPTSEGTANQRRWSLGAAGATDQIVCTITNTNTTRTTVTVNKISLGGTGAFGFSGSNGIASHAITTNGSGVPAAGPTYQLTTAGAQTTITEGVPPAGFNLQGVSCSGLGSGGTATPNLSTRTVTLNAAATAAGSAIICTFTNSGVPILRLQKSLPNGRVVAADQFALGMSGPGAPAAVTTTGSGSTAAGVLTHAGATVGATYTLSETGANGANLANYATTYACTNTLSGGQTPSGSGTSFSVTPVFGDNLTCTFSNAPLRADLSITKTNTPGVNGDIDQASDTVIKGNATTYTLVVRNNGPAAANGAVVRDTPVAGLSCGTATCAAAGASQCPAATGAALASALQSGAGVAIPLLPAGAANAVTFTLACQVQ